MEPSQNDFGDSMRSKSSLDASRILDSSMLNIKDLGQMVK